MRYVVKFYRVNADGIPTYVAWDTEIGQVIPGSFHTNQDRVRLIVTKLNNGENIRDILRRTLATNNIYTVTSSATNYPVETSFPFLRQ